MDLLPSNTSLMELYMLMIMLFYLPESMRVEYSPITICRRLYSIHTYKSSALIWWQLNPPFFSPRQLWHGKIWRECCRLAWSACTLSSQQEKRPELQMQTLLTRKIPKPTSLHFQSSLIWCWRRGNQCLELGKSS